MPRAEHLNPEVHLTIPAAQAEPPRLERLKTLLGEYSGNSGAVVYFVIPGRSVTEIRLPRHLRVKPTRGFLEGVREISKDWRVSLSRVPARTNGGG